MEYDKLGARQKPRSETEPTEWKWEAREGREVPAYPKAAPGDWVWVTDNSIPDPPSPSGRSVATNIFLHAILMGGGSSGTCWRSSSEMCP